VRFSHCCCPEPKSACDQARAFENLAALDDRQEEEKMSQARAWLTNSVRKFLSDESAATAIEYCLIASGIALGIFISVAGIEAKINAKFISINNSLK
jgi:pilus assembly protein Flp/PilA